jgi:hypothetical protein
MAWPEEVVTRALAVGHGAATVESAAGQYSIVDAEGTVVATYKTNAEALKKVIEPKLQAVIAYLWEVHEQAMAAAASARPPVTVLLGLPSTRPLGREDATTLAKWGDGGENDQTLRLILGYEPEPPAA